MEVQAKILVQLAKKYLDLKIIILLKIKSFFLPFQ